jgi:hypothetical protein
MELSEHKKTPVRNRGFVPGRSEVVQPLRSRDTNIRKIPEGGYNQSKKGQQL